MTDKPLMERITEGVQAHHEAILNLQELAAEFTDETSRMRSASDRMQESFSSLDTPGSVMRLPTILKGGPKKVAEA